MTHGFSEGLTVKETFMMLPYEVYVLTRELPNTITVTEDSRTC